jgi:hypothetical protein
MHQFVFSKRSALTKQGVYKTEDLDPHSPSAAGTVKATFYRCTVKEVPVPQSPASSSVMVPAPSAPAFKEVEGDTKKFWQKGTTT